MKKSISGIRGIFGDDMNLTDIIEFTNGFAKLVKSRQCVVARDTRRSGALIQEAAIAALNQNGIDTYTLDVVPTPVAFREARRYGAGLVITASHNPQEWNGLKFVVDGRGINQEGLDVVLSGCAARVDAGMGEERHLESSYVNDALAFLKRVGGTAKVLVDPGGGAATHTATALLEGIGCDVTTVNDTPEGSRRGPDPTVDKLDDLVRQSAGYDIGFAFDLDGDRLVIVSDGVKHHPDVTLGLGVAEAIEMGHKRFVFSLDTSIAVERMVREGGGTSYVSKVGEANVIDEIVRTQSHAGGEGSSGGFILPGFNHCRDGILTSALVASMSKEKVRNVIEYMNGYQQIREKIPIESALHKNIIEDLVEPMKRMFAEVTTIDGIKAVADEDTWVLVRGSNTEDIMRVSAESNDAQKVADVVKITRGLVVKSHDRIK